ncbi:MAG: hypothetical protein WCJ21_06355 [Planctomycetota bacterium]
MEPADGTAESGGREFNEPDSIAIYEPPQGCLTDGEHFRCGFGGKQQRVDKLAAGVTQPFA